MFQLSVIKKFRSIRSIPVIFFSNDNEDEEQGNGASIRQRKELVEV